MNIRVRFAILCCFCRQQTAVPVSSASQASLCAQLLPRGARAACYCFHRQGRQAVGRVGGQAHPAGFAGAQARGHLRCGFLHFCTILVCHGRCQGVCWCVGCAQLQCCCRQVPSAHEGCCDVAKLAHSERLDAVHPSVDQPGCHIQTPVCTSAGTE